MLTSRAAAASSRLPLLLAVTWVATACSDLQPASAPRALRVRLAASIGPGAAGRQIDLTVFYTRESGERVTLATQRLEADTATRDVPVTIDVTSCLRDGHRAGGQFGCPIRAKFVLLDPTDGAVDSMTVGPINVTGTESHSPELPVATLVRTAAVKAAPDSARVHAGDTITVSAQALDAAGALIRGRTLVWASEDQRVATVGSAGGIVTGVGTGRTTLTATREGLTARVAVTVPITGVQRWVVGERLGTIGRGSPIMQSVPGIVATPHGNPVAFGRNGNQLCQYDGSAWSCNQLDRATGFSAYRTYVGSGGRMWLGGSSAVGVLTGTDLQVLRTGASAAYYGVWASDSGKIFAVGSGGATAYYDGGRWTTTPVQQGLPNLHDVWGSSPTNVIAVGDSGVVLRFDGTAWRRTQIPERPWLYHIWGVDSTHVYAVGSWGALWFYDGGNWRPLGSGPFWDATGVHGTSPTDVYIVAAIDSTQWLVRWDGRQYTRLARIPVYPQSVYAVDDGRVFVSGSDGYTGVYENGTLTTLSLYPSYYASMAAAATLAVVASGNQVWRYDGMAWTRLPRPWPDPYVGTIHATAGSGPADVFASASLRPSNFLLHFNGTAWTRVPLTGTAYAMTPLAPNDVLVRYVRWNGSMWVHSLLRCSAASCRQFAPESPSNIGSVWASSPTNVFISGYDVRGDGSPIVYYVSRYDGRTWQRTNLDTNAGDVWGPDSATVLLPSNRGTLRYDYRSGTWTPVPGLTGYLGNIWGTAYDDLYAGGCGSISRHNGRRWTSMSFGDNSCVLRMVGLPDGGAIATVEGALVLRGVGPSGTFAGGASSRSLRELPGMVQSDAAASRLEAYEREQRRLRMPHGRPEQH